MDKTNLKEPSLSEECMICLESISPFDKVGKVLVVPQKYIMINVFYNGLKNQMVVQHVEIVSIKLKYQSIIK